MSRRGAKRVCAVCRQEKLLTENQFRPRPDGFTGGYRTTCRKCEYAKANGRAKPSKDVPIQCKRGHVYIPKGAVGCQKCQNYVREMKKKGKPGGYCVNGDGRRTSSDMSEYCLHCELAGKARISRSKEPKAEVTPLTFTYRLMCYACGRHQQSDIGDGWLVLSRDEARRLRPGRCRYCSGNLYLDEDTDQVSSLPSDKPYRTYLHRSFVKIPPAV